MKNIFKVILSATVAMSAVAVPAQSQAQSTTAKQTAAEEPTPASADGTRSDTIVVTGSRIRRPNFVSAEPTVTVDREYIQERGITNVADALNEMPAFRSSVTPAGSQSSFGQGVNFVNAFGLGSNRTLTLVNGRRFVTSNTVAKFGPASGGTQVDLNDIPTALVDRIDTVSVGGAPVYGSDAIAGTVNVILKTRFSGYELSGSAGVTQYGDNGRLNLTGVAGWNFGDGRGNISASLAYDDVKGVLYNDRDFLRANLGNATNPSTAQAASLGPVGRSPLTDGRLNPNIGFNDSATDGFPGTIVVRDLSIYYLTPGGADYSRQRCCDTKLHV